MKKYIALIGLLLVNSPLLADIPQDPKMLMPPPPVAPRTLTQEPLSGTDSATQSSPMNDMDTMPIQSAGTSDNYHPESKPIPLDNLPNN